jgi:hypothetical protein
MTPRGKEFVAVATFLSLFALQAIWAAARNAPTADEMAHHVASGYSYLASGGDFRMNPASPPFPRMLSAAPLFLTGVHPPFSDTSWESGDSPRFANRFFYHSGVPADTLIFWARMPIVVISLLFAVCVWVWTRRLWGVPAGLAALLLYTFCPDIVAHSSLATADLTVAFFFFISIVCFTDYLDCPGRAGSVRTGFFAGLTFLSKFTALLLIPILFLIAVISGKWRELRPSRAVTCLAVMIMTIWAGYFFEVKPLLQNTPDPTKKAAAFEHIGGPKLLEFAQNIPVPLATFSTAVVSMGYTRAAGTSAYLMGEWSRQGWKYYYFVAFAVKNTPPFVLLSVLSLVFIMVGRSGLNRVAACAIVVPTIFFFVVTVGDKAQAGIRYFLPVYPLLFTAAGGLLGRWWQSARRGLWCKVLVAGLLVWHAGEAVAVGPHYLTYFSSLAGGPDNGYKWLRDSNLDWGQGLKDLAVYAKRNPGSIIVLHYPWPADPAAYDFSFRPFRSEELERPGSERYAIAVHWLDDITWLRGREPDAKIGHSIFVYDLTKQKVVG